MEAGALYGPYNAPPLSAGSTALMPKMPFFAPSECPSWHAKAVFDSWGFILNWMLIRSIKCRRMIK
jgi:hypothetical protein